MRLLMFASALLLPFCWLSAAPAARNYAVEHYDVHLSIDLSAKNLSGEVSIRLHSRIDRLEAVELDAGGLKISSVSDGQSNQYFERKGRLLIVVLTTPFHLDEQRTLTIRYQAGPAKGLVFFPDQVYTSFFTSDWMVCNDRPDEPATLRLAINAPADLKIAATEELETPTPPFLYAFAVGAFEESTSEAEGVKLRVLGHANVFEQTAAALRFLSEKSGHRYPGATYTQVSRTARSNRKPSA